MDTNPLFTAALGLTPPWRVVRTDFDASARRLELEVDFTAGSRFACPDCGSAACPVHDTAQKRWRHMDFFQHQAYLIARVPRIECPGCGVRQVQVPWARSGSGFTLLFEALILELARNMPVAAIARLLAEHDTRIWRIVRHYVDEAVEERSCKPVRHVGVDETSAKRRYDYITLFFDLQQRRLIYATSGRDAGSCHRFATFLQDHDGDPLNVREVSCDMSDAYAKGIAEALPEAKVTLDRFHIQKVLSTAVDAVRRQEWRRDRTVKGARYLLLRNPEKLTRDQAQRLDDIMQRNAALAEAYRLKETFRDFYRQQDWQAGRGFLKAWVIMARRSGLEPMQRAAQTIQRHWKGILHWFVTRISNAIMEGLASLIQAAKRKARGYRTHRNFITMAYLIAGKLDLAGPATHSK